MNELTFSLPDRIKFANLETGEDDETFEIFFKAPDWGSRKQMFKVKAHVERAFVKMASELSDLADDDDKKDDSEHMDGALVMTMLAAGSGDLEKVFDDFTALAVKVGRFNDKTPLLPAHIERMGINEAMRLCGEYIGFFVMPSVLSTTKKSGSDS